MMKTEPPLTRDDLILAIQKGLRAQWVFFWKPTPSQDGSITESCLCQWWEGHPFEVNGIRYATAEHFMMAEKARLFHDEKILAAILEAPTPATAKALGREVANFDYQIWLPHRCDIVIRANIAKFGQHEDLRQFLLQTGDRILAEASPTDRVWGIGLADDDPDAQRPQNWKGLNLLGFALMSARHQLNAAAG
jgi:ribA/ribD-fused uncharacterized protein